MKKMLIALAIASAPLAACSTLNTVLENAPVTGAVCAVADQTLIDEKVVFAAETLFNIPADAYEQAVLDGHLPPGDLRTDLRAKLIKLDTLRNAIYNAKGTVNCDFASMKALHSDIMTLIPRSN